jgi:anthranilate phosphoribosyltransferase
MKAVVPVRGAMGVRTVFNILGPLCNPAAPPYQLTGAYSNEMAAVMAETLAGMPLERAFVVHGYPGWDEATPAGEFHLYDVQNGKVAASVRTPDDYGLATCRPEDLAGGEGSENATELVRVFKREDRGAHRDALLMGTSLVLELLGTVDNPRDGVAMAAETIDDGRAAAFLDKLRGHFGG